MSVNFLRDIQGSWKASKMPARLVHDIVVDLWGPELLKSKMDKDGYVSAVIEVSLSDLLACEGVADLNDIAEDRIFHDSCFGRNAGFSDIEYKVVGFVPASEDSNGWGSVYIRVTGFVGDIVEAWEEQLADETNKFADSVMTTSGGIDADN